MYNFAVPTSNIFLSRPDGYTPKLESNSKSRIVGTSVLTFRPYGTSFMILYQLKFLGATYTGKMTTATVMRKTLTETTDSDRPLINSDHMIASESDSSTPNRSRQRSRALH